MAEKVLSLSTTEFNRPIITIDGTEYKMRAPEELTVAMQKRLEEASSSEDETALIGQVRVVMADPIPDEVFEKLGIVQLGAILRVFTERLYRSSGRETEKSPTPESSPSPAVSDSSAAH